MLQYVPASMFARLQAADCSRFDRAAAFATLCRINTLYMIMRAGSGHIGSSFSSLDIVSWLYLNELRLASGQPDDGPGDVYFSSKGHDVPGLYAVLAARGLLDFNLLHRLRRLDGLPGHPDVATSGIVTNTGSLGMGISKAKGMIAANRLAKREGRVYVLLGDGEIQEGQFWESLISAANRQMAEIVAIIDHNKIQSDTWVSRVSDLGDLDAKISAFGWHVQRCEGHDFSAIANCIDRAKTEPARPNMIIADTIKGADVSAMQWGEAHRDETLYPFHSGAPSPEVYAQALEELSELAGERLRAAGAGPLELAGSDPVASPVRSNVERLVPAYAEALADQGRANPKVVSLDADLVLDTGQIPFRESVPERFIECGIAEQDMVSQAGGLALKGYLPIVHSFACFLSARPNEQIFNNATEGRKIIYVGSLAGILPGGPGHSHQCVRDISALGAIPNLVLIEPSCPREVKLALDYAINGTDESTYLRLVSIPCEIPFEIPDELPLIAGQGSTLAEGDDAIIVGYGPVLLAQALNAARLLKERNGLKVRVLNLPWLNRIDSDWLRGQLRDVPHLFTLDNHFLKNGQGEMLAAAVAELALRRPPSINRFGVETVPACGTNEEVLRFHELDAESLALRMARAMGAD